MIKKELTLVMVDVPTGLFKLYAKNGETIVASSDKNDKFAKLSVDFVKEFIQKMMSGTVPQKAYLVQSMMPKCQKELDEINGAEKIYYCKDCGLRGSENEGCFAINSDFKNKIEMGYYDIVLEEPTELSKIEINDALDRVETKINTMISNLLSRNHLINEVGINEKQCEYLMKNSKDYKDHIVNCFFTALNR